MRWPWSLETMPALLTAVLQCVESEIRQAGASGWPYAEDAAFFVNVFEFS